MKDRYLRGLTAAVGLTAGAYGYTLVIRPDSSRLLAGAANVFSAGAAVAAAYALAIAIGVDHLAWPVTAFAA